jgi:L-ascorbate metabolism protein UlaG (beta-lactamase superfamily)
MEMKPRWAEMCARILHQCAVVEGGRENLAKFLDVHPHQLALWLAAKGGPPRTVFEKAMEIILAEHDRRTQAEQAGRMPRRRSHERQP